MARTENPAALAGAHRAGKVSFRDDASSFVTKTDPLQAKSDGEMPVTGFRSVGQILHGMGFAFDKAGEVI